MASCCRPLAEDGLAVEGREDALLVARLLRFGWKLGRVLPIQLAKGPRCSAHLSWVVDALLRALEI